MFFANSGAALAPIREELARELMLHSSKPFVPRTKLRPPRLPDDILVRTRLFEPLDRPQLLSLIVAPAGYGKTTLAANWLAHCGRAHAWLALERTENAPEMFLAGLVGAVRRASPRFGDALLALLEDPTVTLTPPLVLPVLLNELDRLEQEFVLVLDDYHCISDAFIHGLLYGMLTYPPQSLQFVITARHDPPIPARLRCQGIVTELRSRDLRFTEAEASAFLEQSTGRRMDPQSLALLVAQAEGWAVPLRLIALALGQRETAGAVATTLYRCGRSLLDYLDAEVIGQLPADVQAFLVYTSILPRLQGALCDTVIGERLPSVDSAVLLPELAAANIFVEPLDEDKGWYRYHEQFRILLQHRLRNLLGQVEIDTLEKRARGWFEGQGLPALTAPPTVQNDPPFETAAALTASPAPGQAPAPTRLAPPPYAAGRDLRELITFREMDVLLLLSQRLTNKEIAGRLGISPATVRQHSVNLYRKLGVASRRQAVVRASALGIFAEARA
jgi:LuxR family maltose regulon positive regulatory protein